MYQCQLCKQTVPAKTKAYRIPVEIRPRKYPACPKANRVVRKDKTEYVDDPGGEGYEIVQEVFACPGCAAQFEHRMK